MGGEFSVIGSQTRAAIGGTRSWRGGPLAGLWSSLRARQNIAGHRPSALQHVAASRPVLRAAAREDSEREAEPVDRETYKPCDGCAQQQEFHPSWPTLLRSAPSAMVAND